MALDFPTTATIGLVYTATNGVVYTYDGLRWRVTTAGETDPIYNLGIAASISAISTSQWNLAYGWGNHATRGYLTSTISQSVIPSTNAAYDLGSTSSQWRSLYVSTNTIYIGGTPLNVVNGQLSVNGNPVSGSTSTLINGTYTFSLSSTGVVLLNNSPYDPLTGLTSAVFSNLTVTNSLNLLNDTIKLGLLAGENTQTTGAIAIGYQAGQINQSFAIGIGVSAGQANQGFMATAVGNTAGLLNQGTYAVAVGTNAGQNTQGAYAVAIGPNAGTSNQSTGSIIINATSTALTSTTPGLFIDPVREDSTNTAKVVYYNLSTKELTYSDPVATTSTLVSGTFTVFLSTGTLTLAGPLKFTDNSVQTVAWTGNVASSIKIGLNAGLTNQSVNSPVAIGELAGNVNQGNYTVAVGYGAGLSSQQGGAVAIGGSSGNQNQGPAAVAIGANAGNDSQGSETVAIGSYSGSMGQANQGVAVGYNSAYEYQGTGSVAIGAVAGAYSQGIEAVALGRSAGETYQGTGTVAIGYYAGNTGQGDYSIAIGRSAGFNSQPNNSIILNATGIALDGSAANAFYVAPIRSAVTGIGLYYEPTTGEITTGTVAGGGGGSSGNPNVTNVFMFNSNSNYGMAANTETLVPFDATTTGHDVGDYDTSTKQFTPTVAGWYNINVRLSWSGSWSANVDINIWKNNSLHKIIGSSWIGNGGAVSGSALVYFDGISDYTEVKVIQKSGGFQSIETGASKSWMQCYWVRD
jgi:hypothetical protein